VSGDLVEVISEIIKQKLNRAGTGFLLLLPETFFVTLSAVNTKIYAINEYKNLSVPISFLSALFYLHLFEQPVTGSK
jgi:hypothetical protein